MKAERGLNSRFMAKIGEDILNSIYNKGLHILDRGYLDSQGLTMP